ncbi:hypothetical protein [Sphingobium yanoikuyae]|uniref:hypothetical protein n=1 Tax=Sphingobium yanoikuyae TaxID=13690 RepID=UPI000262C817|nr:hypothetical protein [Sphingobium yanoikuyae]
MTKMQANVLIGILAISIIGAGVLYFQHEERMARLTQDQGRCWSSECVIDIGSAAADRLGRAY